MELHCNKCKGEYGVESFYKDKSRLCGFSRWCKSCYKNYEVIRTEAKREWSKNYYQNNKERFDVYRKYYTRLEVNIERRKEHYSRRYKTDTEFRINRLESKKKYRSRPETKLKEIIYKKVYLSRPEVREKINNLKKKHWRENPQYKISNILRHRMKTAIKNDQKTGSAIRDLGCTVSFLKNYIQSKFQEGMTWENWSMHGWHLDHIIPLCRFDLTKEDEFKKAAHYTNLQPLWARDNIRKQK